MKTSQLDAALSDGELPGRQSI